MSGSDPLVEVKDLHIHFRTYEGIAEVVNGIDFTIERGETAALVGETGCGKSVTVKTIMGLLPEAIIPRGEIYFDGRNILEMSHAGRRQLRGKQLGFIMQDPMTALNPVFTVGEQMMDTLRWEPNEKVTITKYLRKKVSNESGLREKCIDILNQVQISSPERVFNSYPTELSGGMAQRVLIAIALLKEPEFLIADEPGTALDVTTESNILDLFDELIEKHGTSVLYITHDLGVAREVSEKVNVMYAGEIVEQAPTTEIFSNPRHPYTRGLLESIPTLSAEMGAGIDGSLPDYVNPPNACRFKDRCKYADSACGEVYPYIREVGADHNVACHLWDGDPILEKDAGAGQRRVHIERPAWVTEADRPTEDGASVTDGETSGSGATADINTRE